MSAVGPIFAALGHISRNGKPPCRVWQVGEGVSPTLDAGERVGGLVSASSVCSEVDVARDGITCQFRGNGHRSNEQVTTEKERRSKLIGAEA